MRTPLAMTSVCLLLVGCSNDSNPDIDPGISKAEVLQEVGVLLQIVKTPSALYYSYRDALAVVDPTPQKLKPVTSCVSGSVSTASGTASRPFSQLPPPYRRGPTAAANFVQFDYQDCERTNEDDTRDLVSGTLEAGELTGFNPVNVWDTYYTYTSFGQTDNPYIFSRAQADENSSPKRTDQISGRIESASSDMPERMLGLILTHTQEESAPGTRWQHWSLGEPNRALQILTPWSGFAGFRLNGPYRYSTSTCPGGDRVVDMESRAFFNDEQGFRLTAFGLSLESDRLSFEFDQYGNGTVQLPSGDTLTLTSDEVVSAVRNPVCIPLPPQ